MEAYDFFEFLTNLIDKLTIHSYICECQARYLKQLKNELNQMQNVCVVLANFSENYSMTVQDEIQSFHFNKPQLHNPSFGVVFTNSRSIVTLHSTEFSFLF